MTLRTWHFYSLATGLLTGRTVAVDDEDTALLQANTPADCGAIVGVTDWMAQRVDIETGALVDYQPPAPADDAMRTWQWDAEARRWVAHPTQAAIAAEIRRDRDRRLAACDWVVLRATELGEPVPAAWLAYRAALRSVPDQPGFPASVEWPTAPA